MADNTELEGPLPLLLVSKKIAYLLPKSILIFSGHVSAEIFLLRGVKVEKERERERERKVMAKVSGVVSAVFMAKANGNGVASAEFKANGNGSPEFHANLHRKETVGDGVMAEHGNTIVSSVSLLPPETENSSNGDVCFSSAIPGWYADAPPLWPGLLLLNSCHLLFFFSFLS